MKKFTSLLVLLIIGLCSQHLCAQTQETVYFSKADGLPGTEVDGHLVWESPVVEFTVPVDAIRFTYLASQEYDQNGIPRAAIAELELFDAAGNKIEYTAADVSTNSLEFNEKT